MWCPCSLAGVDRQAGFLGSGSDRSRGGFRDGCLPVVAQHDHRSCSCPSGQGIWNRLPGPAGPARQFPAGMCSRAHFLDGLRHVVHRSSGDAGHRPTDSAGACLDADRPRPAGEYVVQCGHGDAFPADFRLAPPEHAGPQRDCSRGSGELSDRGVGEPFRGLAGPPHPGRLCGPAPVPRSSCCWRSVWSCSP